MSAPVPVEGLVVSGLTEPALGALVGWPMSLAVSRPDDLAKIGIRSAARLRQWHLDLIALGGLTMLAATAVPDVPAKVGVPLAVGAWTNANAFGVLAVRPDLHDHPVYRGAVIGSFAAVSWGWAGLTAVAVRRARAPRPGVRTRVPRPRARRRAARGR
jgi:hypothetical protein